MTRLTRVEMAMALLAGSSFAVVARGWKPAVIALCLAIFFSWYAPWRYSATPRQQRRLFALLGLPFMLLAMFRMAGSRSAVDTSFEIAVLGTVYVFLGAVIELYRQAGEARAEIFHSGVMTVMMVAGIPYQNRTYPYFLGAYAVVAVALLRSP